MGTEMVKPTRIAELTKHKLAGEFEQEIPNFEHISPELYEGDPDPFHLNLAVAEVGRTSGNGLLYDEMLVSAIERGLAESMDGINGHIPDSESDSAFPLPVVYWVGSKRVGNTLWAKGYIPPSPMRNHVRMKKAMKGKVGTSIYGIGIREEINHRQWRLLDFTLEQLDLVQADRAALDMRKYPQFVTAEMQKEGGHMPESIVTLNDVPTEIREQIIAEARLKSDASRVAEMEAQLTEANAKIAELLQYGQLIGTIRATLGVTDDVSAKVTEMYNTLSALRAILGHDANIEVAVAEMHQSIGEMKRATFERAVTDVVAELTNWNVKTQNGQAKLASLRNMLKGAIVSQMGTSMDVERLRETAQSVLTGDLQVVTEAVREALSGGPAMVGAAPKSNPRDVVTALDDPKVRAELKAEWGIS
jgi:hypothetical protein